MTILGSIVTEVGSEVSEMAKLNMLILFSKDAPADLKNYCVVHDQSQEIDSLQKDDVIEIANQKYTVALVGATAIESFNTIGHTTLKFGIEEQPLSGSIYLVEELTVLPKIGDKIRL